MEAKIKNINFLKDSIISFSENFEDYFVCMVDIVGSTNVIAYLSHKQVCKYYTIFLNTMAAIAEDYGGKVVKNIGDCLLYYFPKTTDQSVKLSLMNSLECGLAMLDARNLLNELMREEQLPPIGYRVSADYGKVMIARQTNSSCDDIFGPSVNMCAKINHHAKPNSMVVGSDMYEIAKSLHDYRFKQCSDCSAGLKSSYPVYSTERITLL